MKLLAFALAVAPLASGPGTLYFAGMPPERFRATATLTVVITTDIPKACKFTPPEGKTLMGCARRDERGQPYIVIGDPCPDGEQGEAYARILCHELAHAAGHWGGDHPL